MVKQIFLAKIYFTDLSEYKIRPVIVIKMLDDDCICLQLTTQLHHNGILLNKNELVKGNLKKSSMIIIPKNFTLHKSILFKYLATVSDEKFNNIYLEFCKKLECKGLK